MIRMALQSKTRQSRYWHATLAASYGLLVGGLALLYQYMAPSTQELVRQLRTLANPSPWLLLMLFLLQYRWIFILLSGTLFWVLFWKHAVPFLARLTRPGYLSEQGEVPRQGTAPSWSPEGLAGLVAPMEALADGVALLLTELRTAARAARRQEQRQEVRRKLYETIEEILAQTMGGSLLVAHPGEQRVIWSLSGEWDTDRRAEALDAVARAYTEEGPVIRQGEFFVAKLQVRGEPLALVVCDVVPGIRYRMAHMVLQLVGVSAELVLASAGRGKRGGVEMD